MTDQKQAKETLIEKIAYEQFGRERLDDLLAKLFLLEQFLETYNSDLRTKLEEVTKERDGLRVALEKMTSLYTRMVNSGDAGFWNPEKEAEVILARSVLAKTKEAV